MNLMFYGSRQQPEIRLSEVQKKTGSELVYNGIVFAVMYATCTKELIILCVERNEGNVQGHVIHSFKFRLMLVLMLMSMLTRTLQWISLFCLLLYLVLSGCSYGLTQFISPLMGA